MNYSKDCFLAAVYNKKNEWFCTWTLPRGHVHMLIGIPPHLSVSRTVQYLKGKSSHKPVGPRVAVILSVIESCRRPKTPVRNYLADILPELAIASIHSFAELTPAV
jgi:REP element-mobilizing transposase RayT